jgi:hypothetical protein
MTCQFQTGDQLQLAKHPLLALADASRGHHFITMVKNTCKNRILTVFFNEGDIQSAPSIIQLFGAW